MQNGRVRGSAVCGRGGAQHINTRTNTTNDKRREEKKWGGKIAIASEGGRACVALACRVQHPFEGSDASLVHVVRCSNTGSGPCTLTTGGNKTNNYAPHRKQKTSQYFRPRPFRTHLTDAGGRTVLTSNGLLLAPSSSERTNRNSCFTEEFFRNFLSTFSRARGGKRKRATGVRRQERERRETDDGVEKNR